MSAVVLSLLVGARIPCANRINEWPVPNTLEEGKQLRSEMSDRNAATWKIKAWIPGEAIDSGNLIHLTYHALRRMEERQIPLGTVQDLIENGTLIHKDEKHCWIFKSYPNRDDNLVYTAVVR